MIFNDKVLSFVNKITTDIYLYIIYNIMFNKRDKVNISWALCWKEKQKRSYYLIYNKIYILLSAIGWYGLNDYVRDMFHFLIVKVLVYNKFV